MRILVSEIWIFNLYWCGLCCGGALMFCVGPSRAGKACRPLRLDGLRLSAHLWTQMLGVAPCDHPLLLSRCVNKRQPTHCWPCRFVLWDLNERWWQENEKARESPSLFDCATCRGSHRNNTSLRVWTKWPACSL